MSTRKALVDLSKKISRASISKVRPRTSVRSLFTSEKLEIKDKNIDSVPEKFTTNNERWNNNQTRSDLPLHSTNNTNHQQSKQLDLHAEVLKNMENGKFSTRVLTAPPETYAKTSIAGSDVLITWFQDDKTGGEPITIGRELYDTRTGIRQKIEGEATVITPSYIVSRVSKGGWQIQNRSTNETKTVNLSYFQPHSYGPYEICESNLDLATETVLINEFASDRFYVIDLETGEVQQIKRTDPSKQPFYASQLYGTLIAYREYSKKSALRVIDTMSGKEILNFGIPDSSNYCLMSDQIALAEINHKGKISWSIIDLNGKTIKEGNFETKVLLEKYIDRNIFAYKNFLIISQGPFIHFIDISSGKLLTTLTHGNYGYSQISGYDEGKFIISTAHGIQVVDFESPDPWPDPPVKAVVINPNETISTRTGTINDLVNGIIYSEDSKPSKQAADTSDKLDLECQNYERRSSLVFNLSATERVTLVHFPNKTNCAIITRMKRKSSDYNYQVRPLSHVKKNFYGRGLLYKEELVDGKWVPVDLSVQQAEEFINSFAFFK